MELPDISIPKVVLDYIPMDQIPALAHPPLVHFAIVLPIMIVLLELVNIIVKSGATPEVPKGRGVSTLSFLLILAMVVIFAGAFASGTVDGKATWSILSKDAQSALGAHKLLGTYLVFASLGLLLFKLLSLITGRIGRILLLVIAIAFAGVVLKQGKAGGELVYKYGANVQAFKDSDEKVFDLNDDMSDLKEDLADCEESQKEAEAAAKAETTPAPAEVVKAEAKVKKVTQKEAVEAVEESSEFKEQSKQDAEKITAATEMATEAKADVAEVTKEEAVKAVEESSEFKEQSKGDAESATAAAVTE